MVIPGSGDAAVLWECSSLSIVPASHHTPRRRRVQNSTLLSVPAHDFQQPRHTSVRGAQGGQGGAREAESGERAQEGSRKVECRH